MFQFKIHHKIRMENRKIHISYLSVIFYVCTIISVSLVIGLLSSLAGLASCEKIDKKYQARNEEILRLSRDQRFKVDLESCPELEQSTDGTLWESDRLPKNVVPLHYDLNYYTPIFQAEEYSGDVTITVDIKEATDTFIVHSKLLSVYLPRLTDSLNNSITLKCAGYFLPNEYFILRTYNKVDVSKGPLKLTLYFTGLLNIFESGLFEIKYKTGGAEFDGSLLTSHLEPLDARKAFPCFDEPAMKATYKISIDHPDDTVALSNMPTQHDEPLTGFGDNIVRTIFQTTPRLPPYMIGITVFSKQDFTKVSGVTQEGKIPISIWARKQYIDDGYANDVLNMAIDLFDEIEYFFYSTVSEGTPQKIDLLALPEYPDDAVPHFGLPIFRENKILFSEKTVTQHAKQTIALLIAKQFAEFWFGNLVTFTWWDEIWLQEGLGDYFKYKIVDQTYPNWRVYEQFITEELIQTLVDDAYPSSHPVVKDIYSYNEIEQLFDDVETSKVASIFRMIEYEVGDLLLKNSLISYLQQYKGGVGDPNFLFSQIGKIRKWNAADFVDRWFKQVNYPSISITLSYDNTNKTQKINIIQDRFINSEESIFGLDLLYPSPYNFTWFIPLKCTFGVSSNDTEPVDMKFDVDTKQFTQLLGTTKNFTWVHCDQYFAGYYMMDYSRENWLNLGKVMKANNSYLQGVDRANIIHNLFVNSYSEKERYSDLVEILSYLHLERDYIPWRTVHKHVTDLASILQYRSSFYQVSRFFGIMMREVEQNIDLWEPSGDHVEELTKSTILDLACKLQDVECLKNASIRWKTAANSFQDDSIENTLAPHIRPIVYNYHFQNTYNIKDWDIVYGLYESTNDLQEQHRLLEALTFTRLPHLLNRYLESSKSGGIKLVDFFDAVTILSKNPLGREVAWNYYRRNYEKLLEQYGLEDPDLGTMLIDISSTFEDEFLFFELLRFIIYTPPGSSLNARFKSLEIVSTTIVWLLDKEDEIVSAFGPRKNNHLNQTENNKKSTEFKAKLKEWFKDQNNLNKIYGKK